MGLRSLATPLQIGRIELKNRFVMPGMQRAWCRDGKLLPGMAEYYARRAAGGSALIIGEGCAVDHPSSIWDSRFPHLNTESRDGWSACANAVHAEGGAMLLQLSHPGAFRSDSQALPGHSGPALSPSGLYRRDGANGRAATITELAEIRASFVDAALHAQATGMDGIELHACHGFFLDQFLWAETNLREDGYGGDNIVARTTYPAEIVRAIRAATGKDFLISFRFSQWKEVDYAARIVDSAPELEAFLALLRSAGVDIFHPSTRRFHDRPWPGSEFSLAGWVKRLTDAPVIAVGSVGMTSDVMTLLVGTESARIDLTENLGELASSFERGEFDMIAVGRAQIGDPAWVEKALSGRISEIRPFDRDDLSEAIAMEPDLIKAVHQA